MALLPHLTMRCIRRRRVIAGSLILTATAEATLIYLGRTSGQPLANEWHRYLGTT
jgi:hypothetical protein